MAMTRLELRMCRASKSFTDAVYAILTAAGRWDAPLWMLSGLSGMAFKLAVHRQLLSMSVTAYGTWGNEHFSALDNLGFYTASDGGRTRHATFPVYQQAAIPWIRDSLDQGMGVVYWVPEFGVIHGYDDEDRVFYVQDGRTAESRVVLYDNLGLNETPFWDVEVIGDRVSIPLREQALGSLRQAWIDWNTPYKLLPDRSIASGRAAYGHLIEALKSGGYDGWGACYILRSYEVSRTEIRDYLRELSGGCLPGLQEAAALYAELSGVIAASLPAALPHVAESRSSRDSAPVAELTQALAVASGLEERAMAELRLVTERYPDPLAGVLPRWGAHTPR
ncbi:hypothetical protein PA598K_07207 [Paenibacillus sp. 598K]|uniref:hypothetical protein n=1 Tax=Paenibacillus sp. 598K TaxID=1117987 RepID=UPI000FF9502C|nr:hypothetical protein [Paenibacillus sp. 598K]GBF78539.1 hypothetical protein PA598K_07207 [Paenibacillus sp. 598K]